jgi:maleylpyruvate isomerase
MSVLLALQAELAAADARLLATATGLSDDDVAAPSALPGWTRGHVLVHVARNADSHINLLTWAKTGVKTPQYKTYDAREAEIEAGAARTAAEHAADLEATAARLAAAVAELPEEAWRAPVAGMRPPFHPAWYVLVRRLRELGMHHVDLGAGYGPADWSPTFVRRELHDCLHTWPYAESTVSRVTLLTDGGSHPRGGPVAGSGVDRPAGDGAESSAIDSHAGTILPLTWHDLGTGPAVEGEPADILAWLTGRSAGKGVRVVPVGQLPMHGPADVPAAPPWLIMPAPADLPATPPEDYP